MDNSGFDINEEMLNTVFAYWTPTNAEKSMMEVDESCILYNQLYKSFDFYDNKFPQVMKIFQALILLLNKLLIDHNIIVH